MRAFLGQCERHGGDTQRLYFHCASCLTEQLLDELAAADSDPLVVAANAGHLLRGGATPPSAALSWLERCGRLQVEEALRDMQLADVLEPDDPSAVEDPEAVVREALLDVDDVCAAARFAGKADLIGFEVEVVTHLVRSRRDWSGGLGALACDMLCWLPNDDPAEPMWAALFTAGRERRLAC